MKTIYKNIIYSGFIAILALFIASCNVGDQEDYTDLGTKVPSSPTLDVTLSFENEQTLIEEDKDYPFTVSLSEAQTVDVAINLAQTEGTAVKGVNFDFPSQLYIKAGETSVSDKISIFRGDSADDTLDATIVIGTGKEANVQAINSETVKFTILNYTEGDLATEMSWSASSSVTDNYGNEIDPTDLADLRLLLTDVPYTQIIESEDGSGFEHFALSSDDLADGEYYLIADFYKTMDILSDIDISITFDQVGVINGLTYNYPAALNNDSTCSNNYFIMAKIIKSGDTWEIENIGEKAVPEIETDLSKYVGTWSGTDAWGYPTEIVTTLNANGELMMTGIGFGWMQDWWGEPIIESNPVKVDLNTETGEFVIDIENQTDPYLVTTWKGEVQTPYRIFGTGKIIPHPCFVKIEFDYSFNQGGWEFDGTTWGPAFKETIQLN